MGNGQNFEIHSDCLKAEQFGFSPVLKIQNNFFKRNFSGPNQVSPFSHIFNGTNLWILFSWPNAYICC